MAWTALFTTLCGHYLMAQTPTTPPPATQAPATQAPGGFVGNNACKTCHADVWVSFYKNPHYQSVAAGDRPPSETGCESCHGPGAKHVAAHGGKSTIGHAFSTMSPQQTMEVCLTCHAKDLQKANIQRSEHTLNGVTCTNCHSIHHSPSAKFLLAKARSETCFACHASVRAQFEMPSKHRVNEGFMDCWDCHNPHGTFTATWRMATRPPMVEQTGFNDEACVKCHTDRRGPFVYEHPPTVIEGCERCHFPHGSMNGRLAAQAGGVHALPGVPQRRREGNAAGGRGSDYVGPQSARSQISTLYHVPRADSRLECRRSIPEVTIWGDE